MTDKPLKDKGLRIRMEEALLLDFEAAAKQLGVPPASLARVIIEQFVRANKRHAGHMPWPPKFQYFADAPVETPAHAAGKEQRHALRVAESQERYAHRETTPTNAGSGKEE